MVISPNQLKLLAAISKKNEIRTDTNNEDIEYLQDNGLVVCMQCDHPGDYFLQARITEKGKAFLYERMHSNRRANIALMFSVIALVLSLLTALTPFPDWSKAWISTLFQSISG